MLQVNAKANLNTNLSITTGMAINFVPYIERAYLNEAGTDMIVPLGIQCYKSVAIATAGEYQPVLPIRDGSDPVNSRTLYTQNIEYTLAEWQSVTDVNRGSMETRLIAVLEAWNTAWAGKIVQV